MADTRSPEQRSRIMRAVSTTNTGPEWIVRRLLHHAGYRFRLHSSELPGTPDLVFPSRKKALFVHGCYWHAHGCKIGQPPKSRSDYWLPKLRRNVERDREKAAELRKLGWDVGVVWQCETRRADLLSQLVEFLGPPGKKAIDISRNDS